MNEMVTGNPKIDFWLFIAVTAVAMADHILAHSKWVKGNCVLQTLVQFLDAGLKGIHVPASGIVETIIEKAAPMAEHAIEGSLEQNTTLDPTPAPAKAKQEEHNLTNLS